MPGKEPKIPKKFEWKGGKRTPEQTDALNRQVLHERGLAYPGKQMDENLKVSENLLADIDPDIVKLARLKAEQIMDRTDYAGMISALAHIDKVIAEKKPKEMIGALDKVILTPKDRPQLASETELALAFLMITDEYLG